MAVAALAFMCSDLSHEALGHGIAAFFCDAKVIVLSYTYLSSDLRSKWISAAGPMVSLVEGLLAALALRTLRLSPTATLFVFLLAAFGLLNAASYLVYSGATNSGDLAVVIEGWAFQAALRVLMVIMGMALYGVATAYLGVEAGRFVAPRHSLAVMAYCAPIVLMAGAALFNPLGLRLFLISALPASALANLALLWLPRLAASAPPHALQRVVLNSPGWIVACACLSAGFILVIGPGVNLRG